MADVENKPRSLFSRFLGNGRALKAGLAHLPIWWLIIYVLLFAWYYLFIVPANEAAIVDRSFRTLALLSEQVHSELQNAAVILKTHVDLEIEQLRDKVPTGLPDDLHIVDCPLVSDVAGITLITGPPAGSAFIRVASKEKSDGIAESGLQDHSKISACGTTRIDDLIAPFAARVPYDVFEDIAVTDSRGKVLYQKEQTGFGISDIKTLVDQAAQTLPVSQTPTSEITEAARTLLRRPESATGGFSRVIDITIAGTRYKMFVEPVTWSIPEVYEEKAGANFRLLLCGFVRAERLASDSKKLPIHLIVFIFCAISIALLAAWPILKAKRIPPTEGFRPREVFWFAISILMATRLVTILVLYGTQLSVADSVEPQLQKLACNIESNVRQELDLALATLQSLSQSGDLKHAASRVRENPNREQLLAFFKDNKKEQLLSSGSTAAIAHLWYPNFDQVFWTLRDTGPYDGFQVVKWTVQGKSTELTGAKPFDYYQRFLAGQFWELDLPQPSRIGDLQGNRQFILEPMYSPNTGEYVSVLTQSIEDPSLPRLKAAMMVTPMLSLVNPVLPTGYGFAVLDEKGDVRFHSDSNRNGRESFLREFDKGRDVQAAMLSGSSRFLTGKYQGKDYSVWVEPLAAIPASHWSLVVFLDQQDRSHFYVDVFLLTFFSSMAFGLWDAICIVLGCRFLYGISKHWHWPEMKKLRTLNLLVLFGLAMVVISILCYRYVPAQTNSRLVWGVPPLLIGVATLAFSIHYHGFGRFREGVQKIMERKAGVPIRAVSAKLQKFPFERPASAFLAAALLSVMSVSILPSAMLFRLAFNQERLFYVADQQVYLAEALEARTNRIRLYYRNVKTGGAAVPGADEAFLTERLGSLLDRYDLNLGSERKVLGEIPRVGELANLWGDPVMPLFVWMSEVFPHPLSPTERMTKGWRWKWRLEDKSNVLVMADARNQLFKEIRGNLPIFRWPNGRAIVLLICLLGVIYWGLRYTLYERFLVKLDPTDRWDIFDLPANHELQHNLMIVGWPRSKKTETLAGRADCYYIDTAKRAREQNWSVPSDQELQRYKIAVLDEFQYGIDDPEINKNKFALLSELVRNRHVKVIVISTVDPLFYLFEDYFDPASSPAFGGDLAYQPVYQAALTLSSFKEKSIIMPDRPDRDAERDQLLWATCSRREQLALSQLSRDGAVNPKNRFALEHLYQRRLVDECHPDEGIYHIADPGFAEFVESDIPEKLVDGLRKSERDTAWHGAKRVVWITVIAAVLFLLTAWQDLFKAGLPEITGILTVLSSAVAFVPQIARFAFTLRPGTGSGGGVDA